MVAEHWVMIRGALQDGLGEALGERPQQDEVVGSHVEPIEQGALDALGPATQGLAGLGEVDDDESGVRFGPRTGHQARCGEPGEQR